MNARFFLWSCKLINYFTAPFTRYHESASQRQRRRFCGGSYFGTQNNLTRMCAHLTFETRRRRAESFIHLPWKIFQIKATVFSRVTRFQRGLSSANTSGASLNMVTCTSEWFNVSFREIIDKTEAKKREEQYIQKRFELINCLRMLTLLTFDLCFFGMYSQFFMHDVHGKFKPELSRLTVARDSSIELQIFINKLICTGLRNHESFGAYTLDTTNKGNVGRMINHSCESNASTIELLTPVEFSPVRFLTLWIIFFWTLIISNF